MNVMWMKIVKVMCNQFCLWIDEIPQLILCFSTHILDITVGKDEVFLVLNISKDAGTDVRRTLRSSIGDRSFPVAAARIWNGLPLSVTASQSLQTFRKRLKTGLFQRSYTTNSFPWLNFCNVILKFFYLRHDNGNLAH